MRPSGQASFAHAIFPKVTDRGLGIGALLIRSSSILLDARMLREEQPLQRCLEAEKRGGPVDDMAHQVLQVELGMAALDEQISQNSPRVP